MSTKTTIASLSREITTEGEAYAYFESLRWGDTPTCAHCGQTDVRLIADGTPRKTRTGAISERRVWNCRTCRKQFSVLTNTVMHGTKIPVRTWLMVVFELCSSKNGVAAREIERKYGMNPRSAWFLLHRIREAMAHDGWGMWAGDIVADETYIGGNPKNWHAKKREAQSKLGRGVDKTPVIALINATTGEARSRVIPDASGSTIIRAMREAQIDLSMTTIHTDAWTAYKNVATFTAGHHSVNHAKGEYVSDKSKGTNLAENYFSQLKRSIDGTHHHVSTVHLQRYVSEFDFRYSTRKMNDMDRMRMLAKQVAGRLTYKKVKVAA